MLHDMKDIESDIIKDVDYVKIYYYVHDAIHNKGKLTLISRPYICE